MKLFISYSGKDTRRVQRIAEKSREQFKAEVHWWEGSNRPGKDAWTQIFQWIDDAELVLVVISGNVLSRGLSVGNEVGFAKAKGKLIIPVIIEKHGWIAKLVRWLGGKAGIGTDDLGCLGGLSHIRIDEKCPDAGMGKLNAELKRIADEQQSAETRQAILAVVALIGAGEFIARSGK